MKKIKLKTGEALILRTCNKDGKSHGGFLWPKKGTVTAPDWNKKAECGKGLHGLLWGEGDGSLLDWSETAVWIVAAISEKSAVDLSGKVKFESARIVYYGNRNDATELIQSVRPGNIVGATVSGGDRATVSGGVGATVSGGDRATVSGGDRATVSGGDGATVSGGELAGLVIRWYDGNRYRFVTAYVGENGVEKDKKYQVNNGKLEMVKA